jgi:hypothetical protein
VARAREKEAFIVWVYSIYGECKKGEENLSPDFVAPQRDPSKPLNNKLRSGTHKQHSDNKCCAKDSEGSLLDEEVLKLVRSDKD